MPIFTMSGCPRKNVLLCKEFSYDNMGSWYMNVCLKYLIRFCLALSVKNTIYFIFSVLMLLWFHMRFVCLRELLLWALKITWTILILPWELQISNLVQIFISDLLCHSKAVDFSIYTIQVTMMEKMFTV